MLLCCGAVGGGGVQKGTVSLHSSQLAFSHFPHYPQANWAILVLIPGWVGLCTFWDPVGLSNKLSCEAGSFSRCLNPHRFFQSEVLNCNFPSLEIPALESCVVRSFLLPNCSSRFICMQIWDCQVSQLPPRPPRPPATTLVYILSAPAAHLCPSYKSG